MLLTLALVVLFSSIVILFSQEFGTMFKRIFAIKGAKLFLPLLLASWLLYTFDYWALWVVYYYRETLYGALYYAIHMMPFEKGAYSVALILLLTVISVVPVFLIDIYLFRQYYKHYQYPNVTSAIIWITSAVLLIAMN